MTAVDVLLAIEAAASGEVRPRASVLHRHLAEEPLVIVAYRMAGETAAPLGVMYGTSPNDPNLLVGPEPRSIVIRFREVINQFSADLCEWLAPQMETRETVRRGRRTFDECAVTPQILVPNRATATFLGPVLGRSLRYLRTEGEFAVPPATVLAGGHLTWFGQRSAVPGSCVMLAATDVLRRHWATGQSDLEDEDLHVLLSWIDPPAGMTGAEAAAAMEEQRHSYAVPAIGPTPDADWDRDVLNPLLEEFNEQRAGSNEERVVANLGGPIVDAVSDALAQSWAATWRAREILSRLTPGSTVADRWDSDRRAWTYHADRVLHERAVFRIKDTPRQAATTLSFYEDALTALEAGEALDDPLVLAGLIASQEALLGTVAEVDAENREQGPRNMVKRPLVTLELPEPCPLPLGSKLYWTARPGKLQVEVSQATDSRVVLKVIKGMQGSLPIAGESAAFADLTTSTIPPPRAPINTPWTHVGADTPKPETEVPE